MAKPYPELQAFYKALIKANSANAVCFTNAPIEFVVSYTRPKDLALECAVEHTRATKAGRKPTVRLMSKKMFKRWCKRNGYVVFCDDSAVTGDDADWIEEDDGLVEDTDDSDDFLYGLVSGQRPK